jgi:hypothetical protein
MPYNQPTEEGFVPRFTLNLHDATPQRFALIIEQFSHWAKQRQESGQVPELNLPNGWYRVTPMTAEEWLCFNYKGANRPPTLPTTVYYNDQMYADEWPKTGQPIIFTKSGKLIDGQHRLWAAYLGGVSFETYVVADVPDHPNLFAYLDNGKARNPAIALLTAGLNGQSSLIAQTLLVLRNYQLGAYTATVKHATPRLTPIQAVSFATQHPDLQRACYLTSSEYAEAALIVGHKDLTAFLTYKILSLYDEYTADTFMDELGRGDQDVSTPIALFRKVVADNLKSKTPIKKHHILAHLIKCFNCWKSWETIKKLTFRVNEDFPQFDTPQTVHADAGAAQEERE